MLLPIIVALLLFCYSWGLEGTTFRDQVLVNLRQVGCKEVLIYESIQTIEQHNVSTTKFKTIAFHKQINEITAFRINVKKNQPVVVPSCNQKSNMDEAMERLVN